MCFLGDGPLPLPPCPPQAVSSKRAGTVASSVTAVSLELSTGPGAETVKDLFEVTAHSTQSGVICRVVSVELMNCYLLVLSFLMCKTGTKFYLNPQS